MKNTTLQPSANGVLKKEIVKADKAQNRIAEGLRDLFLDGLKDINWAEKALERALPKMIKNATSDTLTLTLSRHWEMTEGHIIQLESVFRSIDEKVKSKKCAIMSSLVREAEKLMADTEKGMVRDAAIVCINRKIRHYEMANYSVLHSLAITLMEHDAAVLLRQSFEEEKEADEQLAAIAKSFLSDEIVLTNKDIATKKAYEMATNKV
jgi:ferritin-like metal-binding protein YciE